MPRCKPSVAQCSELFQWSHVHPCKCHVGRTVSPLFAPTIMMAGLHHTSAQCLQPPACCGHACVWFNFRPYYGNVITSAPTVGRPVPHPAAHLLVAMAVHTQLSIDGLGRHQQPASCRAGAAVQLLRLLRGHHGQGGATGRPQVCFSPRIEQQPAAQCTAAEVVRSWPVAWVWGGGLLAASWAASLRPAGCIIGRYCMHAAHSGHYCAISSPQRVLQPVPLQRQQPALVVALLAVGLPHAAGAQLSRGQRPAPVVIEHQLLWFARL